MTEIWMPRLPDSTEEGTTVHWPQGQTCANVIEEATRLLDEARGSRVLLRIMGGVAVRLHAAALPSTLVRDYKDLDIVIPARAGAAATRLLERLGYEANERFNAINGDERLVFYDMTHARQLDVFVGRFAMCHRVPIAQRLDVDERTIPLAELLLTKLQVVELNHKDLQDIWAILHEHDVGDHDRETVNADYIAGVLAADWGFWRTAKQTLETARERLPALSIAAVERAMITERLDRLWRRVDLEPKTIRWKSRARIGERLRWYEEPEEIDHRELRSAGPGEGV